MKKKIRKKKSFCFCAFTITSMFMWSRQLFLNQIRLGPMAAVNGPSSIICFYWANLISHSATKSAVLGHLRRSILEFTISPSCQQDCPGPLSHCVDTRCNIHTLFNESYRDLQFSEPRTENIFKKFDQF